MFMVFLCFLVYSAYLSLLWNNYLMLWDPFRLPERMFRSVGTRFIAFKGAFCRALCFGLFGTRFLCSFFWRGSPKIALFCYKALFWLHIHFLHCQNVGAISISVVEALPEISLSKSWHGGRELKYDGCIFIQSWRSDHPRHSREFPIFFPRMFFSAVGPQTAVLVSSAKVWISASDLFFLFFSGDALLFCFFLPGDDFFLRCLAPCLPLGTKNQPKEEVWGRLSLRTSRQDTSVRRSKSWEKKKQGVWARTSLEDVREKTSFGVPSSGLFLSQIFGRENQMHWYVSTRQPRRWAKLTLNRRKQMLSGR